jgi:hypothetical protein
MRRDPQPTYSSTAPSAQHHFAEHSASYTEIELAQRFAEDCGDEFLYIAATGQWYRREVDVAKQPYWAPDETGWLYTAIMITLCRVAKEAPRDIARKIGAAATVAAVEWLARPHFAGTAEHLEPGELGRQEAMAAAVCAAIRAPAAPQLTQPTAAAIPQSTLPPAAASSAAAKPRKKRKPSPAATYDARAAAYRSAAAKPTPWDR